MTVVLQVVTRKAPAMLVNTVEVATDQTDTVPKAGMGQTDTAVRHKQMKSLQDTALEAMAA